MIEEIKAKANDIVSEHHDKIVMGVYRYMIDSHNDFCGCNYCKVLSKYVRLKKSLSARNQLLNEYENVCDEHVSIVKEFENIDQIRQTIRELKAQKNKLKL